MYNTFTFVGTLKGIKNTEKFKSYEERTFQSGWTSRKLKFNVVCGNNRHMVETQGGCFPKKKDNKVYTLIEENVDGKRKYTRTQIPFDDRFKEENIVAVPQFAKFICDTELPHIRKEIEDAVDKLKKGEECSEYNSLAEAETALANSLKKRKEFLSEWDFAEYLSKLVVNSKIEGMKFKVTGDVQFSYYKGEYYRTFIVRQVKRVTDDTPVQSEASLCYYFSDNAVDSTDEKKHLINGWVREYDRETKSYYGVPLTIVNLAESESDVKRAKVIDKRFSIAESDQIYEAGIKVKIIDGSESVEITEDMLSDEQKELLEFGLTTIEEIRAEMGGSVYGDRVQETRFAGFVKGYTSGAKETTYTVDDFAPPVKKSLEDEIEDVIDDDDIVI